MNEWLSPPAASRFYAYLTVAVLEATAAGSADLSSLAGRLGAMPAMPAAPPSQRYDIATAASVDHTYNVTGQHEARRLPCCQAAAEQAATSRLFGGIRYPMAIEAAVQGERVLTVLAGR